jgi:hypothetical protein
MKTVTNWASLGSYGLQNSKKSNLIYIEAEQLKILFISDD